MDLHSHTTRQLDIRYKKNFTQTTPKDVFNWPLYIYFFKEGMLDFIKTTC